MLVKATLRRWGSSVAAVVPPELLREQGLRVGDEVLLDVRRPLTVKDTFGLLRGKPLNAQKVKDAIRREESE